MTLTQIHALLAVLGTTADLPGQQTAIHDVRRQRGHLRA